MRASRSKTSGRQLLALTVPARTVRVRQPLERCGQNMLLGGFLSMTQRRH
jgi:hypothetical protein